PKSCRSSRRKATTEYTEHTEYTEKRQKNNKGKKREDARESRGVCRGFVLPRCVSSLNYSSVFFPRPFGCPPCIPWFLSYGPPPAPGMTTLTTGLGRVLVTTLKIGLMFSRT